MNPSPIDNAEDERSGSPPGVLGSAYAAIEVPFLVPAGLAQRALR
jgi:hypothetical protein